MEKEKQKRKNATKSAQKGSKKKAHRKKYLQAYDNQRSLFEDRAGSAHFIISYDPPKNGNCQFSAICKFLNSIGIHRSNQTIREDIVNYLENNPTAADGTPLQNFTDLPWPIYLSSMSQNGTFGDHITLQAASDLTMWSSKFFHLMDLGIQPLFLQLSQIRCVLSPWGISQRMMENTMFA